MDGFGEGPYVAYEVDCECEEVFVSREMEIDD